MSLAKVAQAQPEETTYVIAPEGDKHEVSLEVSDADDDKIDGEGEVVVQVGDDEPVKEEFNFTLPFVPGGDVQDDIDEPAELEVEEPEEVEIGEPDAWDWGKRGGVEGFPAWLQTMMQNVPRHTGHDTVGLERAVAYLNAVDREISKAVRNDLKGSLDMAKIEHARNEIQNGSDRLTERLDKILKHKRPKKKKADEETAGLVKEAQKAAGVQGRIVITVPLLISRIARVCINGMVSAGHDIEDMFKRQADMYKLNIREKAELMQLLEDMGYALRRDRGISPEEDSINTTKSDNFDWAANYHA